MSNKPSFSIRPPTGSFCPICLEEAFHWYAEQDADGNDGYCLKCYYRGPFYHNPKPHETFRDEPTLKT